MLEPRATVPWFDLAVRQISVRRVQKRQRELPTRPGKVLKTRFLKISPGLRPGPRFLSLFPPLSFPPPSSSSFLKKLAPQTYARSNQHRVPPPSSLRLLSRSFLVGLLGAHFFRLPYVLLKGQATCRPPIPGPKKSLCPFLMPAPCGAILVSSDGGNLSDYKSETRRWHILSGPWRAICT